MSALYRRLHGSYPETFTPTNTVTISGTPDSVAQGVAFTIKITDSANQSASQSYTVSILLEPDTLTFSPSSSSFAPQLIGTPSGAQDVAVTNTGTSDLVIGNIAITGTNAADFGQHNTCGSSIGAARNCTISVTLTPNLPGPRSASITITDNTLGSPHSVSLNGTGLTSGSNATLSATSMAFGNQILDTTSQAQSVTLSNYGARTLSISSIVASTNFGETTTCNSTLASGASCIVNVTFNPTNTGSLNGTLSVADSAADSPQIVSLSGTGAAARCGGKGDECYSGRPCCSGLACVPDGNRAHCEP
ncbi:MAG TPA: choice-of-anchor D domain-containing protein [Candidatus Sulfotelmatobacter sp.]|nr:choice-of-anchor D domain-containing protein [Candidatus Sulfotelmatobacter sp.]